MWNQKYKIRIPNYEFQKGLYNVHSKIPNEKSKIEDKIKIFNMR